MTGIYIFYYMSQIIRNHGRKYTPVASFSWVTRRDELPCMTESAQDQRGEPNKNGAEQTQLEKLQRGWREMRNVLRK